MADTTGRGGGARGRSGDVSWIRLARLVAALRFFPFRKPAFKDNQATRTPGAREWWRRRARRPRGKLGRVRGRARCRNRRYLGDGDRETLPHTTAADQQRHTRPRRDRRGYHAAGNRGWGGWGFFHGRAGRFGVGRLGGHSRSPRGARRRNCRRLRYVAGLIARRNASGSLQVVRQRRRESGSNAKRSRTRGRRLATLLLIVPTPSHFSFALSGGDLLLSGVRFSRIA
jgi:hypothetical protein